MDAHPAHDRKSLFILYENVVHLDIAFRNRPILLTCIRCCRHYDIFSFLLEYRDGLSVAFRYIEQYIKNLDVTNSHRVNLQFCQPKQGKFLPNKQNQTMAISSWETILQEIEYCQTMYKKDPTNICIGHGNIALVSMAAVATPEHVHGMW